MKKLIGLIILAFCWAGLNAQTKPATSRKNLPAKRTISSIKIDGVPDEAAWKEVSPATDFIEWRPNFGATQDAGTRTEVWLLYDNVSIYVAGYCHEKSIDSISKELVGRDVIGVNDYVGVIFDTYNDKINGFGFYLTPLGEQFDAKYSNTVGEDGSWNAVWDAETKIVSDGWTFEMRIPLSAIRFVSKENQTWGLNITRNRKKAGRQFMWNPVDPTVGGFMNQSGEWTGIEKINSPIRLQFSPYLSAYVNHFPSDIKGVKDVTSSINGGMDVKYGINDAFTLDMTLIPDFGQVRSDNQVLNLTPFEIRFDENRPFFTEGTELFSKGNLFYTRRVGGRPINFWGVNPGPDEVIVKNPTESRLINATKVSGRTNKGLGVGVFNAITKRMYATVEDTITKQSRQVETAAHVNYNILVFDQTMKNNSSVSLINLNTFRGGGDRDANVSAALFDLNNKKNTYNFNGKFAVSQIFNNGENTTGFSHNWNFQKTGGRWNFQIYQEMSDQKFDPSDMGFFTNNNYLDHYFWTGYRWLKPGKWYNRIQVNFNLNYSRLYKQFENQKVNTHFQNLSTNVNGNVQFKNLWWAGMFFGYVPEGNDFYEPRVSGWSFRRLSRWQINPWFETNFTKKYYASFSYYLDKRKLFDGVNAEYSLFQRFRFNDKFSLSNNLSYNPFKNDAGFYTIGNDIHFSRRDRKTVVNLLEFKYSFNNKSGINFRTRHYWSKVDIRDIYDLQQNGSLVLTDDVVPKFHQNYNYFTIDAVYTWQFAPGSFLTVVWKDIAEVGEANQVINKNSYFKNFTNTLEEPQNNNLSFRLTYFLDYLDFKKKKKG